MPKELQYGHDKGCLLIYDKLFADLVVSLINNFNNWEQFLTIVLKRPKDINYMSFTDKAQVVICHLTLWNLGT